MIRSFLLIFFVITTLATNTLADKPVTPREIANQSQKIIDQATSLDKLIPNHQSASLEQTKTASDLMKVSQSMVAATMKNEASKLNLDNTLLEAAVTDKILVFITLGKAPEYKQGKKILNALIGSPKNINIVLRGLPDKVRQIDTATKVINSLVGKKWKEIPPVILDPVKFQKYGVTYSPTLIYERDGEEIARLAGQLSYDYLQHKVEEGETGDLGSFGNATAVVEKDFIEDIKERLTKINWEEKKEKALKRFWHKRDWHLLPPTEKARTFTVVPEFELADNILDNEGNIVVRKGEKFNVLTESLRGNPTRFYLIIFDGSDDKQIKTAQKMAKNAPKNHKTIFITTNLADLDDGWNELSKLQHQFKAPVYILDERIVNTFKLEHVPCTVRPSDTEYIIQEYRREL